MKCYLLAGDVVIGMVAPYSEVNMHMGIAGHKMNLAVTETYGVQYLQEDGRNFSVPVTSGEGGLFHDENGYYVYDGEGRLSIIPHIGSMEGPLCAEAMDQYAPQCDHWTCATIYYAC